MGGALKSESGVPLNGIFLPSMGMLAVGLPEANFFLGAPPSQARALTKRKLLLKPPKGGSTAAPDLVLCGSGGGV